MYFNYRILVRIIRDIALLSVIGGVFASSVAAAQVSSAAETFDAVVRIVAETHFDSTLGGVDWKGRAASLRPRAVTASSTAELRTILAELLASLSGSHLKIIASEAVNAGAESTLADVGLELRVVDASMMVFRVAEGSASARAGIRRGWLVRSVNGKPVDVPAVDAKSPLQPRVVAAERLMRTIAGADGTPVSITFIDGGGVERPLTLARARPAGLPAPLPNVPPSNASVHWERLSSGAALIRFSAWHPVIATELIAALDSLAGAPGIVLDLRGNTGGVANMLPWFAGQFFCDPVAIGTFIARAGSQVLNAQPRRAPDAPHACQAYAGPLAILIDGHSHSTTEMFASSMQAMGRARVFGETSFGGVVGAMYDRLPNGDVLEHPVVDFTTPTGTHPEGRGVVPDVLTPLARATLLGGGDLALEAAVRWIGRGSAVDK
jgi:C-terminal processing protease CtpA/Prc